MRENPVLENHYGIDVWTNKTVDSIRREECLCLHCEFMTYYKETNCKIAQEMYEKCIEYDIAFIMTRCRRFNLK